MWLLIISEETKRLEEAMELNNPLTRFLNLCNYSKPGPFIAVGEEYKGPAPPCSTQIIKEISNTRSLNDKC